MPECFAQDELAYFSFWPTVIFSFYFFFFFMRLADQYNIVVRWILTFLKTSLHSFCINTLIISVTEVWISNLDKKGVVLCSRPRYLEINGALACCSVLMLHLMSIIGAFIDDRRDPPIDVIVGFALVPWMLGFAVLLVSLRGIFKRISLIK